MAVDVSETVAGVTGTLVEKLPPQLLTVKVAALFTVKVATAVP